MQISAALAGQQLEKQGCQLVRSDCGGQWWQNAWGGKFFIQFVGEMRDLVDQEQLSAIMNDIANERQIMH